MKQVQKILFSIDFASKFDTLVPWVSTFAEKFGATVYVLFVAQDLANFATFFVPHVNIQRFQEEGVASAKKKMTAAVQEFLGDLPKLETRVEVGSPAEKILELANTTNHEAVYLAKSTNWSSISGKLTNYAAGSLSSIGGFDPKTAGFEVYWGLITRLRDADRNPSGLNRRG